jgi:catechol 2,3-dioxygenase-like lactoylglutathione lyase family enzyme
MKRFHVHVAVDNLEDGIRFYSAVFGAQPTVAKADYAKWMVEDPRLNFAISSRGGKPGVNHLGFQLDSDEELKAMHAQLAAADAGLAEEIGVSCCYSKSDKYWITDPAGVAWETYRTLGSVPMFGGDAQGACCGDQPAPAQASQKAVAKSCCS